jgi:ribonuclease HI
LANNAVDENVVPRNVVEIWTDGGCRGNPGPGGWAALLIAGAHEKFISGAERETTNNRMELTAAIRALQNLKRPCTVQLYTDSEYLRRGISEWLPQWKARNWKTAARAPVKNADLWRELDTANQMHTVSWHWVPAHSGVVNNERVDAMVNTAIDQLLR